MKILCSELKEMSPGVARQGQACLGPFSLDLPQGILPDTARLKAGVRGKCQLS